jgi:hypothetical protein
VRATARANHKRQFSNAKDIKNHGIIDLIGHIGMPLRPIHFLSFRAVRGISEIEIAKNSRDSSRGSE